MQAREHETKYSSTYAGARGNISFTLGITYQKGVMIKRYTTGRRRTIGVYVL